MPSRDIALWQAMSVMALLSALLLALFAGLRPVIDADTAAYLMASNAADPWIQVKAPYYGWLIGSGLSFVPALQLAVFWCAVAAISLQARRFGASRTACISLAAAALFSTAFFTDTNVLIPESLGLSGALFAVAGVTRAAGGERDSLAMTLVVSGSAMACILRPIWLPMIVVLPLLFVVLRKRPAPIGFGFWVLVIAMMPAILLSAVRYDKTGEFDVESFGGYQASGLVSLMLTPNLVERLRGDERATAQQMLALRIAAQDGGLAIGIPRNSSGVRSFPSTALEYPDVLARTYDDIKFRHRLLLRRPGESWPAFDARLLRTDLAVIRAAPLSYVEWLAGASARFAGHALVLNPLMLVAATLLVTTWLLPTGGPASSNAVPGDVKFLGAVTVAWLVAAGLLSITASFPAGRYIDSASMFLPALPLYFAARRLEQAMPLARLSSSVWPGGAGKRR